LQYDVAENVHLKMQLVLIIDWSSTVSIIGLTDGNDETNMLFIELYSCNISCEYSKFVITKNILVIIIIKNYLLLL
jgi:hypothetical protein